ncbi:putative glutamate decarboxylase [Stachybotrys elegans]|uniref:Glutamate decarboxylase n=1 Tax=Stachybotrys elegans TaxID=80388 RepID=A0A8K0WSY7_9HYPO|nr:putative glutamate decarboxylase [Stachybotrys elegans]
MTMTASQDHHVNGAAADSLRKNAHNEPSATLHRAEELEDLLVAVRELIIPFIRAADEEAVRKESGDIVTESGGASRNVLVDCHAPAQLAAKMQLVLPDEGQGKQGLLQLIQNILQYSVNTWDQGFLDKLYSSNTPAHVYQVSPALTIVEKTTSKALANLCGFTGPFAGGVTCQGGSASNLTSLVVARNTLYPDCKSSGTRNHDFAVFTSAHGHYSVEKAAMITGMGASCVVGVPTDDEGRMKPEALRELVVRAKEEGKTPLYVNCTAGTTVMGSFDPFEDISGICKEFGMWMHIDASWGGPVIFSRNQKWKMKGSHLADSLTINPHKMMNAPVTCSFLLGPDMQVFNRANSTSAGYLFHGSDDGDVWDMADLTLQCGRRADSLKVALAWLYYGADGFERQIDHAFAMASRLAQLVKETGKFTVLSSDPPPCLQVCFYYAPEGRIDEDADKNTRRTKAIVQKLINRGFMTDYAPGDNGYFLRVVVNIQTLPGTIDGLVKALVAAGEETT